uniref:Uncharacterized protein n=1 Tax=Oryza sativa subsp. japonica TaxID=39947 RepID=Q109C2_ORYSJ|nr:hypothetical protein LOC_Os10g38934 [Oryza sativa Japonica Group]
MGSSELTVLFLFAGSMN